MRSLEMLMQNASEVYIGKFKQAVTALDPECDEFFLMKNADNTYNIMADKNLNYQYIMAVEEYIKEELN